MGRKRKLKIFTEAERKEIYDLPLFSLEEREYYFNLTQIELDISNTLRSDQSRMCFMLMLGYFKAKRRFFTDPAQPEDIDYISTKYFDGKSFKSVQTTTSTRSRYQSLVLGIMGYRLMEAKIKADVTKRAYSLAKISVDPVYILRGLIHFFMGNKIVVPSLNAMQSIVGTAASKEQQRVENVIDRSLSKKTKERLDAFFEDKGDKNGVSILANLKKDPTDFSYTQTREEIKRKAILETVFEKSNKAINKSGISNETVKYFGQLTNFYTIYKLKRMNRLTARLYLASFVVTRYLKINDNLVTAFIYNVSNFWKDAKQYAKEEVYKLKIETNENLPLAGCVLEMISDNNLDNSTEIGVLRQKSVQILSKRKMANTIEFLKNGLFDEDSLRWFKIGELGPKITRNLRTLFKAITFSAEKHPRNQTKKCLTDFENLLEKGSKNLRKEIPRVLKPLISKKLRNDVLGNARELEAELSNRQIENRIASKAEFFLYQEICNSIEADKIFAPNTIRYLSFEDDLIDIEVWKADRKSLLKKAGLERMSNPKHVLKNLQTQLDKMYCRVNERIENGTNDSFKPTPKRKNPWTLVYPSLERNQDSSRFFSKMDQVAIYDVMQFVEGNCSFVSEFTNLSTNKEISNDDAPPLLGCIIAYGTMLGLHKMAGISDLGIATLRSISKSYLRLETLRNANDKVINATAKLPMFELYNRDQGVVHSSSDGQKLETKSPTIRSRFSPKYFGLKKGVVGYTLVANHIPIIVNMIGGNDHESHYVSDLLINNTSDIQPQIHSTDTHGVNNVNFLILHSMGYQFAPRYKNLAARASTSLVYLGKYQKSGYKWIAPNIGINETNLCKEWDGILRILASLALRKTTQSVTVKKLSSSNHKNKTKKAMWDLDSIYETLHILRYIDDPDYRQGIQGALNRGESYHSLRRSVSIANREIPAKGDVEQELWNECSRLLANVIEYYNMALLSKVLEACKSRGRMDLTEILKRVSAASWEHINLHGQYLFRKQGRSLDIDKIADLLSRRL